jgi:hypothetical protein
MVGGISGLLSVLADQISNFKAQITINPSEVSGGGFDLLGIHIPSVKLDITGGGESFAAIGSALSSYAKELNKPAVKWDSSIYRFGDGIKNASSDLKDLTKAQKENSSATNDQEKAYQELLKTTIDMIKKRKQAEKDALEDQLDAYKKIIDARKELLDQQSEERDYNEKVAESNKEVGDIQAEILALQFDNSEEAVAKRLLLQEKLSKKQKELENIQYDNSIDIQKDALDKEYDDYKNLMDSKIKVLDDYLNDEDRITKDAMRKMQKYSADMMESLSTAASGFGNALSTSFNTAMDSMLIKLQQLRTEAESVAASTPSVYWWGSENQKMSLNPSSNEIARKKLFGYHDGGIVDGLNLGNNEVMAKLLKGEGVYTASQADNFIKNTLPNLANVINNSNSGISIEKVMDLYLTVQGNMDSSVLPNIEKIVNSSMNKSINSLFQRGVVRPANSFSI